MLPTKGKQHINVPATRCAVLKIKSEMPVAVHKCCLCEHTYASDRNLKNDKCRTKLNQRICKMYLPKKTL